MKISLIVIAALVLLGTLVIVVGYLLPQRHLVSRSASFHATPEKIFALLVGPQTWRPEVLRTETVYDASGRTLIRETTQHETIAYEVLNAIPNKSLQRRIATENLPYAGTWSITLESAGEMTSVRIAEDGQVFNPVFRFVSRFLMGHTRTIDAYLQNLGKALGEPAIIHN